MAKRSSAKVRKILKQYKFKFRMPGLYKGVDPDMVGVEVIQLEDKTGGVTTKGVLEAAHDTKSELHKCFEWDDEEAAHICRMDQARKLIANLQIVNVKSDSVQESKRVYIHVSDPTRGSHYRRIDSIGAHETDTMSYIMSNALRDINAWMNRYEELRERLPGVFKTIEEALTEHDFTK